MSITKLWQRLACPTMVALSLMVAALPVRALTEEQILRKLQNLPVYTLVDAGGYPLQAQRQVSGASSESLPGYVGVFFSRQDAENHLEKVIRARQPDLAKELQVRMVDLAEIYRRDRAARQSNNRQLSISYVGPSSELANAQRSIQQVENRTVEVAGVPLFIPALRQPTGSGSNFLTVTIDNRQIIPCFFSEADLRQYIQKNNLTARFGNRLITRILDFEQTIAAMENSNDANLDKFAFAPLRN
jgi:hypothetical protein